MGRHADTAPTPPPPPPRPLLVVPEPPPPEPVPDSGHFRLILGVVAMLCSTALATSMVLAGHTTTVGGLLALVLIVYGVVKVVDLLRKTFLALLDRFS